MNTALLLVIENSKTNLGAGKHWKNKEYTKRDGEPLEEEAIECVKSWRKYYANMNIYCICPSKKVPKRRTIDALKDWDVTYIERYFPETEHFTCGYWNVPLACSWLETNLNETGFIHTDLDMKLIRPIPIDEMFVFENKISARVGALPDKDRKDVHIFSDLLEHHESNFIFSMRDSYFYHDWLVELRNLEKQYNDPTWERYADLEEFAIDKMYKDERIEPLKYYQVGPRYKAKDIPDNKLDQVYFIHRHPYESDEEYGKYLKRYLKWKK